MSEHVTIKNFWPPNIDRIREDFPYLPHGVILAYDNVIYNPHSGHIPRWLIAHEQTHFKQQGDDPDGWWENWLTDEQFRFEQELEAHRAEYQEFCKYKSSKTKKLKFLKELATRLSSELYGKIVSRTEAARMILEAKNEQN